MKKIILFSLLPMLALLISCQAQQTRVNDNQTYNSADPEEFLIVDCLLPGQLRKLGQSARYLTARRPIKTSASDCEIRGGEYVAYDRANYSTALKIWLPKAKEGDAEAQAYVGEIYEKGLGLEPDYEVAINWYLKAAQQGNTRAQLNLGYIYETGLGVKADKSQAMKWYRKASGLAEKQIAYTYTAETAVPVQNTEVRILKAELSTSQNEAKRLNEQLQKTRRQVVLNQQKLLLSQSELKKSRSEQINNTSNPELSEVIKTKELTITEQKNRNQQLDKKYKNEVRELELKLSETEKRANQLVDDLRKNKSEKNSSQLQLLNIQAQLASTEKQLLKYENKNPQETVQDEQLNQAQKLKLQIELEKHQLKSAQKQLIAYQQEKNQQLQTIQELTTKNKRYKQKIQQLNDKLSSSNVTQTEFNQLKNELARKKQASEQSQRQLKTSQQQYQLNEDQYRSQEELYNVKLNNLDSEKKRFETLYANSFKQSQSDQTTIAQLIKEKNQQWDEQQKKINTLNKEKQQLNEKLLAAQTQARKESTSEVPVIEIIDPVFVQLRGVPTVTLRSVVKQRKITGKVTSAAGISSLTVNDKDSPVDQLGLFKQSVSLIQTETPVHISAIDNRGKKAILDFIISMGEVKKRASFPPEGQEEQNLKQLRSLNFGQYYAIIIANNKYRTLPYLSTPINDGKAIERILSKKYGFKTKLLENATRYQILSLLNEYRSKLTKNDNLLVYYAGHGELDRVNMRGHWLPVDADADNTANWISTVALTDIFNSLAAKHLMVVADSCYSGAMTRSSLARLDTGKSAQEKEQWLKAMLRARSRTILSSGGLKPVLDGGGGDHSVFAKAFIDSLQNNEYLLEGQALYRSISTKIVARAADYGVEQVPEYAPIRHAGHEAGEFFFVPTL